MKKLEISSEEIKRLLAEQIKGICIVRRTIFEKRVKIKRRIEMPMDDEIKIQVFDGRYYKAWKKRILMYLKRKECYEPTTREKMDTDAKDNWDEKNQWAMNYIYCSITNEQLEFVGDQDTA